MKKEYLMLILTLVILCAGNVSALKVENVPVNNVIISEIGNPSEFDITIDTEGLAQNLSISAYNGIVFEPSNIIAGSGVETYRVKVYLPQKIIRAPDSYKVEYIINGDASQAVKDILRIEVLEAKDVFEISPINIMYGDDVAKITIKNTVNQTIESFPLSMDSLFFKGKTQLEFEALEEKVVQINIDKEEANKLSYGKYIAEFEVNNSRSAINVDIDYVQKEESRLDKEVSGFIIIKTTLTRTNVGNVPLVGEIESSKDVFSRLFTTISSDPNTQDRNALRINYIWSKELQPGESYSVTLTTNYTLPVILILLIIIVAVFVRVYLRTNIILDKRVSYVKTKGGEFALKVRVRVKARKYVENVEIIDRLPVMTQLYEKFGVKPDRIDASTKRLFWDVNRLNAGEERVYSYVIYSKVNVVGRFELPAASATYNKDGKTENAMSNRAFFVAETGL